MGWVVEGFAYQVHRRPDIGCHYLRPLIGTEPLDEDAHVRWCVRWGNLPATRLGASLPMRFARFLNQNCDALDSFGEVSTRLVVAQDLLSIRDELREESTSNLKDEYALPPLRGRTVFEMVFTSCEPRLFRN